MRWDPGRYVARVVPEFSGRMQAECPRAGLAFAGTPLAYLSRIVHLDLKPANVFVVIDPVTGVLVAVKVIDFGLAITFPNPHRDPFVLHRGTAGFKSPEVCQTSGSDASSQCSRFAPVVCRCIMGCHATGCCVMRGHLRARY